MEVKLPETIPGMLNKVPVQDQPKGEEEAKFWRSVAYELAELLKSAARVGKPQVVLNDFRQAGSQYIWEFYVNDLAVPRTSEVNWHGQNVSQWDYAGAIVLSNGRVSLHT